MSTLRTSASISTLVIALSLAASANAQTTYRWIDPASGGTVISDLPPPPGAKQIVTRKGEENSGTQQVPFATQQATERFPVTLYTAANCMAPCEKARTLLNGRGIPFSEKMLQTEEEMADLKSLLGTEVMVPTLSVGKQLNRGFESGAWNNLLDLAGYPKTAPYGTRPSGAFAK